MSTLKEQILKNYLTEDNNPKVQLTEKEENELRTLWYEFDEGGLSNIFFTPKQLSVIKKAYPNVYNNCVQWNKIIENIERFLFTLDQYS
jgi:hypothetical protein